jgi:hypothetical protein
MYDSLRRKDKAMSTTTTKNIWDFLEESDCPSPHTKELFTWSLNYDHETRPFNLFLDMIGYSEEHYGTQMWTGNYSTTIGYVEADYLGDALKEWADNPQKVEQWITNLFACEDSPQ